MSSVAKNRTPLRKISASAANAAKSTDRKEPHECIKRARTGFDLQSLKINGPTRVPLKKTTPPKTTPTSSRQKPLQASPKDERESIQVNDTLYYVDRLIGTGGSSMVYVVENEEKEKFAMKIVNLRVQKSDVREALLKEIEILKLFKGSDRIIQIIDSCEDTQEGRIIIIQELGGEDLRTYIEKNLSKYNFKEIMNLWIQMLEAVNECHEQNILHADLKPENFIFVGDKLKLIDFGIALKVNKIDSENQTTSVIRNVGVGTLSYMAPEAINMDSEKKTVGRPADIWALGSILYRLVFRSLPFPQTNEFVKIGAICGKLNYEPNYDKVPGEKKKPYELDLLAETIKSCLIRNPKIRVTAAQLLVCPCVKEYKRQVFLLDFINWVQEQLPVDVTDPDMEDYFYTREGHEVLRDFICNHAYGDVVMENESYEEIFKQLGEEIIKKYIDSEFNCSLGDLVISKLSNAYLKGKKLSIESALRDISNEKKSSKCLP